jgi:hypothetical protein
MMEKIEEDVVTETCMEITELLMARTRTVEGAIMILGVAVTAMVKRLPPGRRAAVIQALMNGLQYLRAPKPAP